jgi:hypothetical protein
MTAERFDSTAIEVIFRCSEKKSNGDLLNAINVPILPAFYC